MKWYYVDSGNSRVGPLEEEVFKKRVADGTIKPETLVWKQGMADWQQYSTVQEEKPAEQEVQKETTEEKKSKCSQCGKDFLESDLITYQDLLVCANCKPAFLQKIKEGVTVLATTASDKYGSIEKGIRGQYFFSISDILSEAWNIMKGSKRYILGGTIVMYIIVFLIGGIFEAVKLAFIGNAESNAGAFAGIDAISQIATTVVSYPITAGIMMIGVRRAVGLPIDFSLVFNYFNKTIPLILMNLLRLILVLAGTLLLIIPGIYLLVSYSMATPLLVEKNLGPWEALETSRKAVTNQWFKIFGYFIVIALIMLAGGLLLFIGLIWAIPLLTVGFGILYRTIFGVEEIRGK